MKRSNPSATIISLLRLSPLQSLQSLAVSGSGLVIAETVRRFLTSCGSQKQKRISPSEARGRFPLILRFHKPEWQTCAANIQRSSVMKISWLNRVSILLGEDSAPSAHPLASLQGLPHQCNQFLVFKVSSLHICTSLLIDFQ
jgi:hypothetical protein